MLSLSYTLISQQTHRSNSSKLPIVSWLIDAAIMMKGMVFESDASMTRVRRLIKGDRKNSGRMDILAIALISLILVGGLIFVLLRIIGHSEEHVDKVRKTKVKYKEALRWRPDSKFTENRIRADFAQSSGRREADYGSFDLSEKSMKLIGKMSRLKSLNLTRATLKDEWLAYLTSIPLHRLTLHGTPITDKAVPYLLMMKQLEFLTIGDTELTDKGLEELSSSKSIKSLEINMGRCLTNDGIKHLGKMLQLEHLEISVSKTLTGKFLAYLTDLKNMQYLCLENIQVKPEDLAYLSSFKRLGVLDLSNCNLTDKDIHEIAKITSLTYLNVTGSNFTDKGLRKLSKLKRLTHLTMKDCPNVDQAAVENLEAALPQCQIKYSQATSLSKKLGREDVKMELNFLKFEARKELEKSKNNSKRNSK